MMVTAPVLVTVAALLLSADSLLASLINVRVDVGSVVLRLVLASIALWIALVPILLSRAGAVRVGVPKRRLRPLESNVLLGGLALLFLLFSVSAGVAALAGDDYVQRRTGLSYAQYARRGFFQLLAVVAIAVVVLIVTRVEEKPQRKTTLLAICVVGSALALVVIACVRLGLSA